MPRHKLKKLLPVKRHHTERYRTSFITRWSVAKGGFIGFLTGLGLSSIEIEKEMGDGTSAATVRRQQKLWRLPMHRVGGPRHRRFFIDLTFHERAKLARQAAKRGLTGEEYIRRMIVCAIGDDMYDAIVDREFE